jgi:hypothetical protein
MSIKQEEIVKDYIDGYNQFNVDKMTANFDDAVVFKNVQNGSVTLSTTGLMAFKQQAEKAKEFFSQRTQTIKSFKHTGNQSEIDIDYYAVVAVDLPNGLKKGQELVLSGKSIFEFHNDRVIKLTDIV